MRQSTAAVEMLFERHQKNGTERTGSDRTCDTYARRDEHDAEGGREGGRGRWTRTRKTSRRKKVAAAAAAGRKPSVLAPADRCAQPAAHIHSAATQQADTFENLTDTLWALRNTYTWERRKEVREGGRERGGRTADVFDRGRPTATGRKAKRECKIRYCEFATASEGGSERWIGRVQAPSD